MRRLGFVGNTQRAAAIEAALASPVEEQLPDTEPPPRAEVNAFLDSISDEAFRPPFKAAPPPAQPVYYAFPKRDLVTDLDEAEYHADPCERPSLSSSIATVLDRQSPLHAHARHPKLGGVRRPPSKAMDRGTLIHALLLGGSERIEVVHAGDWRLGWARAERDRIQREGRIALLEHEHGDAARAAKAIDQRLSDLGITLDGYSEVSAFWTEPTAHGDIQCRARFDHLTKNHRAIYDLKSCRSAHPEACSRHSDAYGYAIQRAAYVSALESLHPELAGRVDYVLVFLELEPPYAVTPVRLSGEFRALGERQWRRAVERWGQCLSTNQWPGYATEVLNLEPPRWALTRDLEREALEGTDNEESGDEAAAE